LELGEELKKAYRQLVGLHKPKSGEASTGLIALPQVSETERQ